MERTQQLFEKIEEYLAMVLSEEDMVAFEKEMAADPELRDEVEKQRELHHILSDKDTLDFKEKIQKIAAEIKQEESKANTTSFFSYWKIAASIIIILGVGGLLWNNLDTKTTFSDLYASHYVPYPAEDVTRGETENKLDTILKEYTNGNYEKVIRELQKITTLSKVEQLRLYLGNSYLNTNKEQEAILQFERISDTSKYYEDASWYRALTYLKLGDSKTSKEILESIIQYNGIYKENAMKLIEKIME
ncbi:tetratricopeptide repeat protein [Aquimarina sp. 2201CG14-23]|uniref:tetratricopeptide repeat protein n=1 Tax=Aquimarina mycalae TaxID=3040073 RepID=UPI002477E4C9|nr:tetratricopeptide repeat protein [Aquimarina sp. 2201CG14-23]MDH7446014.1 hypothetical protein [Aquimarina sp. 2201CG14-23]